eukprot:TRINITY_DN5977_c1_g1_i1.p1 TRINITY_DN5977_c1_g1~~TRINITY_DN5977_c1_g1_i1.p1  ORF type:complete len:618 (+),score=31.12 TRINITY_DN5977_c1_g1_i1:835-2688(+)
MVEMEDIEAERSITEETQALFCWQDVCFQLKSGKRILENVSGFASPGCLLAIMGPSGCGKTTLLDCLAQRRRSRGGKLCGSINFDGELMTPNLASSVSAYVQQEDALIGALTVRETIDFAARLSTQAQPHERKDWVEKLIEAFGLTNQANTLVGTQLHKGISGGQKRRLSIATQLITCPRIIFLDEPTSGLDSLAAYEIVSFLRKYAIENRTVVIASVHSPSTTTFKLFDNVLLLSFGKIVYRGPSACEEYFERANLPIPINYNPAEFLLEVTNVDFSEKGQQRLNSLITYWETSPQGSALFSSTSVDHARTSNARCVELFLPHIQGVFTKLLRQVFHQTMCLLHRNALKSLRDITAYAGRLLMFIALALMVGTVWLRLDSKQDKIQAYINAMFSPPAFMSCMIVAYIPAYLEDYNGLVKDRANGLYSVIPFLLSNFLIGLPFLFVTTLTFTLVTYWLVNLRQSFEAFLVYFLFIFLELVAAESLVVLIASLFPSFVAALGATALVNGLFMCTAGFLVPPSALPSFYKDFFYQIDYLRYTFEALVKNELTGRVFNCDASCYCMYVTELASECLISGKGIVDALGYGGVDMGKWAVILVACTAVMRLMSWVALQIMAC